jgi:hypothetical protein
MPYCALSIASEREGEAFLKRNIFQDQEPWATWDCPRNLWSYESDIVIPHEDEMVKIENVS